MTTSAHVNPNGFLKHGTKISPDMSPIDVMRAAGCDYEVVKMPLYSNGARVPGKMALQTTEGQYFDIVGEKWQVTQPAEIFETIADMTRELGLTIEAAGTTQNRQNVWAVARTPNAITVGNGDRVEGLIAFASPQKHGKAITVQSVGERLFCANQISFGGSGFARFTHARGANYSTNAAFAAMGHVSAGLAKFGEAAQHLIKSRISPERLREFITRIYRIENPEPLDITPTSEMKRDRNERKIEKLLIEAETMPGSRSGRGTYWQALNLVTHHADHVAHANDAEKQLHSQAFGANAKRKQDALALALEMAKSD